MSEAQKRSATVAAEDPVAEPALPDALEGGGRPLQGGRRAPRGRDEEDPGRGAAAGEDEAECTGWFDRIGVHSVCLYGPP